MGYRRWRPGKARRREFARKMEEIERFCEEHGISRSASGDSYYFELRGEQWRVSNHTQAASDRGMYRVDPLTGEVVKVRESYHQDHRYDRAHEITAGKTRIIEIYTAIEQGRKIDKRGFVIG